MVTGVTLPAQAPSTPTPSALPFQPAWSVSLTGAPSAPPAFSGSRAFLAMDEGRLLAYDLSNGTSLWAETRSIALQPATGEGFVFIAESDALSALREADGSVAWRRSFPEPLAVPLVWDNGWLIAATSSGAIHAFRALDGQPIWHREIGVAASARPALAADRVYVPAINGRIIALQVEDGRPLWERRLGGVPDEMAALDDRLYVGADDNFFYCLRTQTGVVDWRWPTGGDVIGPPVVDERRVYFVSLDNLLRGLDRRSGNQRWRRPLPFRPQTGPRLAGDVLVVNGIAPPLRAYLLKDGAPAGEIATEGELVSPAHVLPESDASTLIVVTLDIEKGTMLRSFTRAKEPAPGPAPDPKAPAPPKP
jgi:outer membrane protein assembly factor BamB